MIRNVTHPTDYAKDVLAGRIVVNNNVMMAAKRHMHDLTRNDIYFDEKELERFNEFVAQLEVADGHELTGEKIVMLPWQSFLLGSVLCWKFSETDGFRFKQAYCEVARGAGKSTMMGVLLLYIAMFWEGSDNLVLANKMDQARQAYDAANKIANRAFGDWRAEDEDEARHAEYETTIRETRCRVSKARFRPMASKTGTLDGTKAILYVCDETAEAKEDYMQKVVSALPKLRDSLMISVTTPGSPELGLDSPYYTRRRVAEEALKPENWDELDVFALFYGLDEDDDFRDESTWIKAQPSLNHVIPISNYRRLLKEYTAQDALDNWERYQMCRYSLQGLQWIQLKEWRTANGPVERPPLGTPIYAAVDFSKSFDLTSLAYGFWLEGKFHVKWHHWAIKDPHIEGVKRHYQRFVENWDRYENVTICNHQVQYDAVKEKLEELKTWGNLKRVGYDALGGMKTSVQTWGDIDENYNPETDLPMWSMPQTIMVMGPSTYLAESFLRHRNLVISPDPVVEYALANVQLEKNINGDRRPCKLKSMGIIDPVVAMVCLFGVIIREGAERPGAYSDLGNIAC
jgi:phage terminase large subunit-like protein